MEKLIKGSTLDGQLHIFAFKRHFMSCWETSDMELVP